MRNIFCYRCNKIIRLFIDILTMRCQCGSCILKIQVSAIIVNGKKIKTLMINIINRAFDQQSSNHKYKMLYKNLNPRDTCACY